MPITSSRSRPVRLYASGSEPSFSRVSITRDVVSGHRRYSGLLPVPARSATPSKVSRPNPTSASSARTASEIALSTASVPRRVRTGRSAVHLSPAFSASAATDLLPGRFAKHGRLRAAESGHFNADDVDAPGWRESEVGQNPPQRQDGIVHEHPGELTA